jgi:hypothetical protein
LVDDLVAMLLYGLLLGGLTVLLVASAGALKEGIRRRGRLRGIVVGLAVLLGSLLGFYALLI